ncbi:PAS domain S-box protein [Fortiea contorta]|uniref:PAS domain S-box protein n=1 Tax=Fortiea contorta TaxID=1892405 RepID=UPI00034743E0|nr:PAS domain S-box protein [Fortiea contorta]
MDKLAPTAANKIACNTSKQAFEFMGVLQLDGLLIEINQAALDFGGLTREKVINRPCWEANWWRNSPENQTKLRSAIAQAATGKSVLFPINILDANHDSVTVNLEIRPLKNQSEQITLLILQSQILTNAISSPTTSSLSPLQSVKNLSNLYADLVDSLPVGLNVWHLEDPDNIYSLRLVSTNAVASSLTGVSSSSYLGKYVTDCYPSELIQSANLQLYAQVALGDSPEQTQEIYYSDRHNPCSCFSLKVFPLPHCCVGVLLEDITQQKYAQQALKASEHHYATLTKMSPVGIFRTDTAGNCLYVNDRWTQITGLTAVDALNQGWRQAVHPEDLEQLDLEVERILADKLPFTGELRFLHPSGKISWVYSSAVVETDVNDQAIGYIGTVMEITERKQAEQASQESEERFRATFEQAAVGIAHVGIDGRWLRVNQKLCEIVGYTRQELLHLTFQEITYPDDLQTDLNYMRQLLAGEIETYSMEKRYICKDNLPCWINLTVSLVRENGETAISNTIRHQPKYFIAVIEDISDRKLAELTLQQRAEELTRVNNILAQTTTILQKRNQELDQFAYVASHDLKAPLRAIANLSEWLEEDLGDQLPAENQHQMRLLRGRVQRMEALINGLLEYSRIGRTHAEQSVVDVETLLQEVIDSLEPPPTFIIDVASEMPIFRTKHLLLQQIFANLISNAIKHNPRVDGHVQISVKDQGRWYEFAVADNGPGISPEYQDKIFVIFQTLESRDHKENTGIGLAIVKKIVETEGGNITLTSSLGKGSTFRFTWTKHQNE